MLKENKTRSIRNKKHIRYKKNLKYKKINKSIMNKK